MIQLVGHHMWRAAPEGTDVLTVEHAERGAAMAVDPGPSRMVVVQHRMQVSSSYASQYRLRLLAADMIRSMGHGLVDFTVPHLRAYLREHGLVSAP